MSDHVNDHTPAGRTSAGLGPAAAAAGEVWSPQERDYRRLTTAIFGDDPTGGEIEAGRRFVDDHVQPLVRRACREAAAAALSAFADLVDRGPTFDLPPSVFSAMARKKATDLMQAQ